MNTRVQPFYPRIYTHAYRHAHALSAWLHTCVYCTSMHTCRPSLEAGWAFFLGLRSHMSIHMPMRITVPHSTPSLPSVATVPDYDTYSTHEPTVPTKPISQTFCAPAACALWRPLAAFSILGPGIGVGSRRRRGFAGSDQSAWPRSSGESCEQGLRVFREAIGLCQLFVARTGGIRPAARLGIRREVIWRVELRVSGERHANGLACNLATAPSQAMQLGDFLVPRPDAPTCCSRARKVRLAR